MHKVFWVIKTGLSLLLLLCLVSVFQGRHDGIAGWSPTSTSNGEPKSGEPEWSTPPQVVPVDINALLQSNLFGPSPPAGVEKGAAKPTAARSAPYEDVSLIGTIAGSEALARALFIEGHRSDPLILALGDQIAGGTIVQIDKTSVLLDYQGNRVTLRISHTETPTTRPVTLSPAAPAPSRKVVPVVSVPTARQNRIAQVERFLGTATLSHHVVDGLVEGIKIDQVDQLPEAERFGLKNGDIVRVINGQALTSKQKTFQVLKKARAQAAMDFEIERDGRTRHVTLPLK